MRKPYNRLTLEERVEIEKLLSQNQKVATIAKALDRPRSCIKREIDFWKQHGKAYSAVKSHDYAQKASSLRRANKSKIQAGSKLKSYIVDKIRQDWSPQQISNRLKADHVNDLTMQISHETIYDFIYVRCKGELRKELISHLRQEKGKRGLPRKKPGATPRGGIPDAVSIHQRPIEIAQREEIGHWEGDLIIGKDHQSGIATLCERNMRLTLILPIAGLDAPSVRQAMEQRFNLMPPVLRKSMTYDRGKEMSQHKSLTENTQVKVFFCDPHSPWQKGSIENTNGLIRQYFPKGTDFSAVTQEELNFAENRLNNRPRRILGWKTPLEVAEKRVSEFISQLLGLN